MRIARHNKALVLLQKCIYKGSLGGCFTIMDATSRSRLPVGVSGTRLPRWLLPASATAAPHDTAADLLPFRPDIMLIAGLPTAGAPIEALPFAAFVVLQSTCVIHLVELTYTHDSCYEATLARKRVQHDLLVLTLTRAGWRVHAPISVILLGTYGTIFSLITAPGCNWPFCHSSSPLPPRACCYCCLGHGVPSSSLRTHPRVPLEPSSSLGPAYLPPLRGGTLS